ncbi:MAG: patatin-like phospholipase family protein [Clostridia bacterium]
MIKILCIDGGGVRGIIPATILYNFETQLKKMSGDSTASISDYFDIIAGTSTGGILSLLYLSPDKNNRPLYSAKDALNLYLNNSCVIFKKSPLTMLTSLFGLIGGRYSSKNLMKVAEQYFGDITVNELLKPSIITAYDINRNTPVYFSKCSYGNSVCENYYIKDVALATSSAPTYFNSAKISPAPIKKPKIENSSQTLSSLPLEEWKLRLHSLPSEELAHRERREKLTYSAITEEWKQRFHSSQTLSSLRELNSIPLPLEEWKLRFHSSQTGRTQSARTVIDGGVFANNPSLCALTECFELYGNVKICDIQILSLGTGSFDLKKSVLPINRQGYFFWGKNIISTLMNSSSQTADRQLYDMYKSRFCKDNYLRIDVNNKQLKRKLPKLDCTSKEDLEYLKEIGQTLYSENEQKLKAFILSE